MASRQAAPLNLIGAAETSGGHVTSTSGSANVWPIASVQLVRRVLKPAASRFAILVSAELLQSQ